VSRSAYPLPFGATLLDAAHTHFRIWAPSRRRVQLEIEGRASQRMQAQDDGWFACDADCGAGTRYRYRGDDGLAVPDPASRAQADDVHGYSVVVDPQRYEWRHPQWRGRPWHEAVIYEVHVGACGGFRGLAQRLPALAALGVTAIELMPVSDFPGSRNWGYDGVLPYAPDAMYGTPDDLKCLIDEAHALKLMVLLDVVYNHFGPDGNYLHAYAAPFFRDDEHTPWGAAIDFRRREVRDYFIHNALYWLTEYRFDGLRLDAVHAIGDDGFLAELAERVRADAGSDRHVHLIVENENNDARLLSRGFDAQWNDDAHNALHVLLTGEREGYYASYAERPAQQLARVLAEGFAFQGEPMPSRDDRPRGTPSAALPPSAFVFFLQNHDQIGNRAFGERLIELCDSGALRAASLLQLLCPQIPLLFMGEERGCRTPFLYFTDHNAELAPKVARGRRDEFAHFAAFADPQRRARIPDPNDPLSFHHSIADVHDHEFGEHADWLRWYRRLLGLRHRHIVPALAGTRSAGAQPCGERGVLARWRLGDGRVLTIAANFGEQPCAIDGAIDGDTLIESAAHAVETARAGTLLPRSAFACLAAGSAS
jgi:malto-oligosyltrehalose trehalohydrolase